MRRIYLTVDDAPSKDIGKMADYLAKNKQGAVFFCRGDLLEENFNKAVYAIKKGFEIGNHSYSHSHFSKIPVSQGKIEILKTEELIEKAYRKAGRKRNFKLFRFPYGDFGCSHAKSYQAFLKTQGFAAPKIKTGRKYFDCRKYDCFWTLDTEDWKLGFSRKLDFSMENVERKLDNIKNNDIVLVHDHPGTFGNFIKICSLIEKKGFTFAGIPEEAM